MSTEEQGGVNRAKVVICGEELVLKGRNQRNICSISLWWLAHMERLRDSASTGSSPPGPLDRHPSGGRGGKAKGGKSGITTGAGRGPLSRVPANKERTLS